ncbi:hypothetical protein D030_1720A, partial [Vibrio parahaemolyticus AQ3810]
MLHTSNPIIKH